MKKITLCGSTRFKQAFIDWNKRLSLEGNVVYSVSCFIHKGDTITDDQKILLDKVHKEKIMASDMIFVLDIGGYVGESTMSEIKFAEEDGKEIRFLSVLFPDYEMPNDPYERLMAGCNQLLNCDHQEHLVVRLNDAETEGLDMIKHAMSLIEISKTKKIDELTDSDAFEIAQLLGGAFHLSRDSQIAQVKEIFSSHKFHTAQTNIVGSKWWKAFRYLESKGYYIN